MKKIAQGIVRLRKLILTVAFLLLIPSAIGAIATRINYDILTYLPQDLDSMIGEVALEDDFHLASTGMITVEGLPTNELIAMKKDIEAVPGVTQTFWLSDVIDPSIPTEMLPADVQQFMFGKNDSTMLIVRFDAPSASDETMEAVAQIEKLLRKDCFFGGMSVILQDTKALVNQEMPLYILIVNKFHLSNSYAALVLPGLVTSYNIFLTKQFFSSIPTSLLESAKLDGCSQPKIFTHIVLPLSKTILAVLSINTFLSSWNNFFWPFLVTSKEAMYTIQVGLKQFKFANTTLFGPMMAGATISALPMFILFFCLQKYFLEGVTVGAVKG